MLYITQILSTFSRIMLYITFITIFFDLIGKNCSQKRNEQKSQNLEIEIELKNNNYSIHQFCI